MRRPTLIVILLVALGLAAGCHGDRRGAGTRVARAARIARAAGAAPAAGAPTPAAAAPHAPAAGGDTVYTWYDGRGLPHTATRIGDIPPPFRGRVVVSRLHGDAADALADQVTVADVSGSKPSYSRVDLAHLGAGAAAPDGKALLANDHDVVIYGTSWCHFCKLARAWLEARHVAFADKDIEADPKAAANMKAKLKAAGIRFGGVPVLDVHGHLIVGFDPKALAEALHAAGVQTTPPKRHG